MFHTELSLFPTLGEQRRPMGKNIDPELYLSNKHKSQRCVVCECKYVRMVSHYKTMHPDCEVFVARLSPGMADVVRSGSIAVERNYEGATKYLKLICPFCESEKSFTTQYWIQHIRSHTGEYANT